MTDNPHIGSSLDDLLQETGDLAEVEAVAIKRVIAWQVEEEMKRQHISKSAMAKRMHTSRAQVDRLLDPKNPSVTLNTLDHAARALGRRLILELA
jgi:antitoxin HicB